MAHPSKRMTEADTLAAHSPLLSFLPHYFFCSDHLFLSESRRSNCSTRKGGWHLAHWKILVVGHLVLDADTLILFCTGAATNPPLPVTTTPPPPPPVKEPTKGNGMMGWIVAGIMVGVLLAGAVGSIMVYRFVLKQAEPCTG